MKSRLDGFAGLSALVTARIYPLVLPQKPALPAVTYQRIDGPRMSGMTAEHGIATPRVQVDSYAATYASAKAVAKQVRLALQRWAGVEAAVTVLDSFLDGDRDLYDDEVEAYRVSADYIIHHRE